MRRTLASAAALGAFALPSPVSAAPQSLEPLTGPSNATPEAVVRAYRPDVAAYELISRSVSPDGVTHLAYNQTLSGLRSRNAGLDAHVAPDGRLIALNDTTIEGARLPDTSPSVTALGSLGTARLATGGVALPPKVTRNGRATTFATGERATLRWYATGKDGARLVWDVATDGEDGDRFAVVVDAESGKTLDRTPLTAHAGQARYFPRDPDTTAAFEIDMPEAWYDQHASGTRLWGQYARTYLDPNDEDPAPGAEQGGTRVQIPASDGTPNWLYTRAASFPGAGPCPSGGCGWNSAAPATAATNQLQAATNAHVLTSRFLEALALPPIGFDKASGNFSGDDYVQVEVNDGEGLNNANFTTEPDGTASRMQTFLFDASNANGADDAGVVYHELTHGLTGRLVTDASGNPALTPLQSRMLGEGWSDFYALDRLIAAGTLVDTATPGELKLATHLIPGGMRLKPPDCPVAPAGLPGCDRNGSGGAVLGGYTYGDLRVTNNRTPHNGGELWAATLWDLRKAVGREAALMLVTGGLRLLPDNPGFLDARDAILRQAIAVRSAPGAADDHYEPVWRVFAARGMGTDATPYEPTSTIATDGYALPDDRLTGRTPTVTDPYPSGDNDGILERGEVVSVAAPFSSAGFSDLTGLTGTLTSSHPGVTILDGTATWPALGRARPAATNADVLAARLPSSCFDTVPLSVHVGASTAQTSVRLRSWTPRAVRLADGSDGGPGVTEARFESAATGLVTDIDVYLDELRHPYRGDLNIELSHAGRTAVLYDAPAAADGADLLDVLFDSDATAALNYATSTGRVRPHEPAGLDTFDGTPAGGTWTLRVIDRYELDTGTLRSWGVNGPGFPCVATDRLEIPAAATGAASADGTVRGTVTPNGRATGLRFAYGTTPAYGAVMPTRDVGAGDAPVEGEATLAGLEPGTTYHYRAEAVREGGIVAVGGEDRTFTTPAAPAPQPTAAPPAATPTPTAPLAFRGRPTVKLAKAGKQHRRATFSFTLSAPATVTAVVTRAAPGIRRGTSCVAVPKRKPKKPKACTRQVRAARGSARPGATTLALPARGLGKGRYSATLTATDAAGKQAKATVTFTVR